MALFIIHMAQPMIFGTNTISYDGAQYLKYGENLLKTHMYTFDGVHPSCGRAPGYPAFLAAFLFLFGSITLVYPVQLALLFIAYVSVAMTFNRFLPDVWRLCLITFLVACWPLNKLGIVIQTEAPFIFATSVALFFLSRFLRRQKVSDLIFFVSLSTLSAYLRPQTLFFVFFAAAVLFALRLIRLRQAIIMAIISAAILAPWIYRNSQVFGKFVPMASNYGSIYYMTDQEAFKTIMLGSAAASHKLPIYREIVGDDFELDLAANERYLELAKKNIYRDPSGFIKRCVLKTIFVWSYLPSTRLLYTTNPPVFFACMVLQLLFLGLAVFGAIRLKRANPSIAWPGSLFAIYHVFILFPFYAESRFLIPVYIPLFGFSAYAVYYLAKRQQRSRRAGMVTPV